jgi:hypothetical protein
VSQSAWGKFAAAHPPQPRRCPPSRSAGPVADRRAGLSPPVEHGALGQRLVAAGGIEPVGNGLSRSRAMRKGPGHGCRGTGGRGEPVVRGVHPVAGTTVDSGMLVGRLRMGNVMARDVSK